MRYNGSSLMYPPSERCIVGIDQNIVFTRIDSAIRGT